MIYYFYLDQDFVVIGSMNELDEGRLIIEADLELEDYASVVNMLQSAVDTTLFSLDGKRMNIESKTKRDLN